MKITTASSDDLGPIRDLLKEADLPYSGISYANVAKVLLAKNDQNKIVGTIEVDGYDNDAMFRYLAIDKEYQTSGIYELIIAAAENHAIKQGQERAYILAHANDKFFLSRGYTKVEKEDLPDAIAATSDLKAVNPENTVCLMRTLKD